MCVLVNSYTTIVCSLGLCVLSRLDMTLCYASILEVVTALV